MDPKSFGRRMRVVGRAVEDNASKLVRRVALAVDAEVVISTPVDTGRARSNWQTELNTAPEGTREAYSEGKEGSTVGPNTQAALDQARATVAAHKPGDTVHITNNLPYIGRLNDGWSAQAPSGYVETAVLTGVRTIRGARLLDN